MRRSRRENEFARCHLPIREHHCSHTSLVDEYFTIPAWFPAGLPSLFSENGVTSHRPQPAQLWIPLPLLSFSLMALPLQNDAPRGLLLFELAGISGNSRYVSVIIIILGKFQLRFELTRNDG